MKFINSALVVIDNKILLNQILNYLYKFNFKKIILLKNKNLKISLSLIKKYNFDLTVFNYKNKKFDYNLIKEKKIFCCLDNKFILLRTSKFINLNLFDLYKIFL